MRATLTVPVIGGTDEQYLYVGHGADCVLLCEHDVPKWRNGVILTPDAARDLAAILIQQADATTAPAQHASPSGEETGQ